MSIGQATIEVSVDGTKAKAGIEDVKRSLNSLGVAGKEATGKAAASIDRYIQQLETQRVTTGKTTREVELYKLALRGASAAQLEAADTSLKLSAAHELGARIGDKIKSGFIALAAAGAAAAAAFVHSIQGAIDMADHLNDLNKTTGISVESLSGLSLAAKQSGGDLDGIASSIAKLSQNMGKDGDKFKELGITAKDPLEAFKQLSDIFVAIDDPQKQAALGAAALGKSWQSAAPLLAEGGESIGRMVEKGAKLSNMTKEIAENADKFNDALEEMKAALAGATTKLAGEMLRALTDVLNAIKQAYIESGKLNALWVGMGAIGAFLFTDEFSSATVKIKNLQGDLNSLEANKKKLDGGGYLQQWLFGTGAEIDAKAANIKAQIAGLQKSLEPPKVVVESPEEIARKAKAKAGAIAKVDDFVKPPKTGAAPKDTARQEAKAQLAFDLEQIKKAADLETNTFSNASKIMEARRAANLIDDSDYYAAKLGFLNLNTQAQESALQLELARLQKEQLVGKDRIDNDRKIIDTQAKLAKVRADAVAGVEVLSTQEKAAIEKITQSYLDATTAAQAYIDTVNKQNAREIAGIGKGEKFRTDQSGLNKIEDKQTAERQALERDKRIGAITKNQFDDYLAVVNDTYAKETEAYNKRTIAIDTIQGQWATGANEAFANYYDAAQNVAKGTEDLFSNAFKGMEDAMVNFVMTGKLSFGDLAKSIIADMVRMQAKAMISGLFNMIGGNTSATGGMGIMGDVIMAGAKAGGGSVFAGSMNQVNERGPELLTTGGKTFLMMGSQAGNVTPANQSGGGTNIHYAPVINIDGSTDMAKNQQMIRSAVMQGNADLVDKLARAGRI